MGPVAVDGEDTGHNAGPLIQRGLDDVIVKTEALSSVTIDPVRRVARVGGGAICDPAVSAVARSHNSTDSSSPSTAAR
ncbi:MAG: hypothetical protein QM650_08825 [Microlunatus sp.]